jgi:sulfide:quinone oxidoreductase
MEAANGPLRVLIAGGGIAGLEALFALADLAGDRVDVTLVAPEPEFTYKPMIVDEPFSLKPAERHELAPICEQFGATFVQQPMVAIHPAEHRVELGDGSSLDYDVAIMCVGAPPRPAFESAATLRAGGPELDIRELLDAAAADESRLLALIVPPGVAWPLPIYEVALMAESRARELGLDLRIDIFTPEEAPLIMFGSVASEAVSSLLSTRGIRVRGGTHAAEADGQISLSPTHETLEAGAVIALPVLHGPAVEGLPSDERGFIPIDQHARVTGADDVYAAGDGTNFPIKQGGIGTQEADAAAEHIAARAGAEIEPAPFHPILRGKLITGKETLSMRSDPTGGTGEGQASLDYLWWPPHKVAGRYLAAFLAGDEPHDPEPPAHGMDVELELPHEWHREPMALDPYGPIDAD